MESVNQSDQSPWGQNTFFLRSILFVFYLSVRVYEADLMFSPQFVSFLLFETETAENIGYSCNMLREEMKDVFIVAANTAEGVKEELQ